MASDEVSQALYTALYMREVAQRIVNQNTDDFLFKFLMPKFKEMADKGLYSFETTVPQGVDVDQVCARLRDLGFQCHLGVLDSVLCIDWRRAQPLP